MPFGLALKCARCPETDRRVLQIDHVNGCGRKQHDALKSREFYKYVEAHPEEFQILCANHNQIKRHEKREGMSKLMELTASGRWYHRARLLAMEAIARRAAA